MTGFSEGNTPGGHEDLGAYLLGGLTAVERAAFEEHLAGCRQCRRELGQLSGLPARLDRLSAQEANGLVPSSPAVDAAPAPDTGPAAPEQVGERLLERLHGRRRTAHRRALALAASVAVIAAAAGATGGYLAASRPGPAAPAPDASYSMVSARGVEARVDLGKKAWGTEVTLKASHLPTSGLLELWVLDSMGHADRAGSWSATDTGVSAVTGAVPVHLPSIERVQVRSSAQLVLAEARVPDAGASGTGGASGLDAAGR